MFTRKEDLRCVNSGCVVLLVLDLDLEDVGLNKVLSHEDSLSDLWAVILSLRLTYFTGLF